MQRELEDTYFRSLGHYEAILAAIGDPAVAFTYSLFIKNQVLGRQASPFEPQPAYEELFEAVRATTLYGQIMAGHKNLGEISLSEASFSLHGSTMSSSHPTASLSEGWLTWILYLNALLSTNPEHHVADNEWETATKDASDRLCCSLTGKLMLRVMSELPGCSQPGNGNL